MTNLKVPMIVAALFLMSVGIGFASQQKVWPNCGVQGTYPCNNIKSVAICYSCCYDHCNPLASDPPPKTVQQCDDCCKGGC